MSRRKPLVVHARAVLATQWHDGPVTGYLVTDDALFYFDWFASLMAGPDGIYDDRWFIVQRLLGTPAEHGLQVWQGAVKHWGVDNKDTMERLDAVPREDQQLWFRTTESHFKRPLRLMSLGPSFDLDIAISIRNKRKLARHLIRCRPK